MEMEGGNIKGKGEHWSIYRDPETDTTALSLSHTTTKPKPKPWERAPVSAHAPRLAGQKIWKKASSVHHSTSQSLNADKENAVLVEMELEMGGVGARKRRRGLGERENIGEAKWVERGVDEKDGDGVGGLNEDGSPRKNEGALRDEDALVVPRKRTNANHLITPRKALRPVEKNVVAGALQVDRSPVKRPAKGLKIPLNDGEAAEKKDVQEKPRPRKSMRKSRRLTRSDLIEEGTENRRASFVFGRKGADGVDSFSGVEVQEEAGAQLEEASEQALEQIADAELPAAFQEESSTAEQAAFSTPVVEADENHDIISTIAEIDMMETAAPQVRQTLETQETTDNETPEPVEGKTLFSQPLISSLETQSTMEVVSNSVNEIPDNGLEAVVDHSGTQHVELETIEEKSIQAAAESTNLQPVTIDSLEEQTISQQPPQTPLRGLRLQPLALQPAEPSMTILLSPTKSVGTPRSRRKTPQPTLMRRSTRTSRSGRNSFVPREEPSAHPVMGSEIAILETTSGATEAESRVMNAAVPDLHDMPPSTRHVENGEQVTESSAAPSLPQDENMSGTSENITADTTSTIDAAEAPVGQATTLIPTEETENEASAPLALERQDQPERSLLEQDSCDEQLRHEFAVFTPKRKLSAQTLFSDIKPVQKLPPSEEISEVSAESFELIEPRSNTTSENAPCSPIDEGSEELHESSTPDPTTTELTEAISENAPPAVYDHDDTDMLRNFLSKVKANKAAKAKTSMPKRKRSLPHSPLRIPLGTVDAILSPPSPKVKEDEFDGSLPTASPSKRRKRNEPAHEAPQDDDTIEPRSIRRSGRTRLPVKAAPAAPSFIPVRRLGQDGDNTVTLRRNEEKEVAALTKVNTRKNKGGAFHPVDVLAKKADEKEGPAARQRALKEVFDERNHKPKLNKKGKSVVWAEELAQYQTEEGKKVVVPSLPEKESKKDGKKVTIVEKEPEREKERPILPGDERKSASISAVSTPKVKVGMRSKMTLGMAANGTPAPKRRVRGRS